MHIDALMMQHLTSKTQSFGGNKSGGGNRQQDDRLHVLSSDEENDAPQAFALRRLQNSDSD